MGEFALQTLARLFSFQTLHLGGDRDSPLGIQILRVPVFVSNEECYDFCLVEKLRPRPQVDSHVHED